jgi:two-component system, LytTR family, response regulator AlgR
MKVLIVDDEPLARERLRAVLSEFSDVEIIGEAENGLLAIDKVAELQPDAVLLDIAMPVMDGLEAARHISQLDPAPALIFCTAFDQHAVEAFEAAAIDYLLKPVRSERLATALQRARKQRLQTETIAKVTSKRRTHLSARFRGSMRLIPVTDIRFLQAEEKYVVVHHARGEDLIEESLKSLEEEFADLFIRIHRNCLVAHEQIRELRRQTDGTVHAILRDAPNVLEVSRRALPVLKEKLR